MATVTLTTAQKAKNVAAGAAVGASVNAAVVGGLVVAAKAAPVVGKAAGVVLSAPVLIGVVGGLAAFGAARAYAKTGRASDAAGGAAAGALGFFPDFKKPDAIPTVVGSEQQPRLILASSSQEAREEKLLKTVEGNLKRAEKSLGKAERNLARAGVDVPGPPTKTPEQIEAERIAALPFGERMLAKGQKAVETTLFGGGKPAEPNAFEQQRQSLKQAITAAEAGKAQELKSTRGPRYERFVDDLEGKPNERGERSGGLYDRLSKLDKEERQAQEDAAKLYRAAGAAVGGLIVGGMIGNALKKGATKAAEAATVGLAKAADVAGKAAKANPKGVIRGTVKGDQAAAAVATVNATKNQTFISPGAAYALPAVSIVQGVAGYSYAHQREQAAKAEGREDGLARVIQTESVFAITMGVFAAKGAMAARAVRSALSPTAATKVQMAENRLAREARGGPSGVAQAKGREKVAAASGKAGVAEAQSRRAVASANATTDLAAVRGSTAVQVATVRGGADVGVAKVQGAARVQRAEVAAKASVSQTVTANNVAAPWKYKDVWQDTRGRIYHRRDMSVRAVAQERVAANSNTRLSRAR
jgi:hypothetical protein